MELLEAFANLAEFRPNLRFVDIVVVLGPIQNSLVGLAVGLADRRHQRIVTVLESLNQSQGVRSYLCQKTVPDLPDGLHSSGRHRLCLEKAGGVFDYFLESVEEEHSLHGVSGVQVGDFFD